MSHAVKQGTPVGKPSESLGTKKILSSCGFLGGDLGSDVHVQSGFDKVIGVLKVTLIVFEQEFGANEPVSERELMCRNKPCCKICWVLVSGDVMPLTCLWTPPNPSHIIANIDIKAPGLTVNISQDNCTVCTVISAISQLYC